MVEEIVLRVLQNTESGSKAKFLELQVIKAVFVQEWIAAHCVASATCSPFCVLIRRICFA